MAVFTNSVSPRAPKKNRSPVALSSVVSSLAPKCKTARTAARSSSMRKRKGCLRVPVAGWGNLEVATSSQVKKVVGADRIYISFGLDRVGSFLWSKKGTTKLTVERVSKDLIRFSKEQLISSAVGRAGWYPRPDLNWNLTSVTVLHWKPSGFRGSWKGQHLRVASIADYLAVSVSHKRYQ